MSCSCVDRQVSRRSAHACRGMIPRERGPRLAVGAHRHYYRQLQRLRSLPTNRMTANATIAKRLAAVTAAARRGVATRRQDQHSLAAYGALHTLLPLSRRDDTARKGQNGALHARGAAQRLGLMVVASHRLQMWRGVTSRTNVWRLDRVREGGARELRKRRRRLKKHTHSIRSRVAHVVLQCTHCANQRRGVTLQGPPRRHHHRRHSLLLRNPLERRHARPRPLLSRRRYVLRLRRTRHWPPPLQQLQRSSSSLRTSASIHDAAISACLPR